MLTGDAIRDELRIIARHPLVWIIAALAIGFFTLAANNDTPDRAREVVETLVRLNMFIPVFILPFIAGSIAPVFFLREVDHGLQVLFAAYPQTPREWLGIRLSTFALMSLFLCLLLQLSIAGPLALRHPEQIAAMLAHSAKLAVVIHIPACLIWACALARISCTTAKSGFVYLAAGFGWLAYIGLATLTGTPLIGGSIVAWEPLRQAMLVVDPYAIPALTHANWSGNAEASTALAIGIGRVGWLLSAFFMVRKITTVPSQRQEDAPQVKQHVSSDGRRVSVSPPKNSVVPNWAAEIGLRLSWVVRDKVFLLALTGWTVLLFPEVYGGMAHAEPLSILAPDSRDALNRVMWDMFPLMSGLFLIFAADRVCRMDSALGVSELTAATPNGSGRTLLLQLMTLWLVTLLLLVLTALTILAAELAVLSSIVAAEYLHQTAQVLPRALLSCLLFASVHGAVRPRIAANLINFGVLILGLSSLAPALGLNHPLWKPLAMPIVKPDHVLGLASNWQAMTPFLWFWLPACLAAFCAAVAVHHRGLPFAQIRLRQIVFSPATVAAVAFGAVAMWQGTMIHRTLESEGALKTGADTTRWQAAYERAYGEWSTKPQPSFAEIRTHVEFGRLGNRADLRVEMQLANRTDQPISEILIGRNQIEVPGQIAIDGADVRQSDEALRQTVFHLNTKMQPGETRTLHYKVTLSQSGTLPAEGFLVLRPQFGSIPAFQLFPVIGFQRSLTLRDPMRRLKQGLPPLNLPPPSMLTDGAATSNLEGHQTLLDTVVVTPSGRYGVAQGELIRQWQDKGRRYFHYRAAQTVRNLPAFFSLPWEPQRWSQGGLTAEIFAPERLTKDDPAALGMQDTLAWLNAAVAPYPGKTLRMIAVPELGFSGYALPQTLLISHRLGFRARQAPGAGFNQIYRRSVHETAHQWFGHLLGYGIAEERAFLVESLAKYAELVMIERRYGRRAMQALIKYEGDRYRNARLTPAQGSVALIDAEDSEDMYSRATLAFACLRNAVGDAAILDSLNHMAAQSNRTNRAVSSLEFVHALKAATTPDKARVVDALLSGKNSIHDGLAVAKCT